MSSKIALDGFGLREIFTAGTDWLERIVPDINALNVYPVPDGDCGTNMLLTMRSSLEEAVKVSDAASISSIAAAIAKGALLGARGNSGVILSQIWRGFFEGISPKETINASDLGQALEKASEIAYQALSNPVEGTILTVIRDVAMAAAKEASVRGANLISVMEAAIGAARISVKNTPNQLQTLKDADVVDAGGHGLFTLIEGAYLHLKGDMDNRSPELITIEPLLAVHPPQFQSKEDSYGFCTQLLIKGANLQIAKIKYALVSMGKSLIVVGDTLAARVHIHTLDPDAVINMASSFGNLVETNIRNMDQQHMDFLLLHRDKITKLETAIIAVVNGDGFMKIFSDLGTSIIIPGGQAMNPGTSDILHAVEEINAENFVLLPNNKDTIRPALKVKTLTKKDIRVIPTETIPQGIAALIAFIPEVNLETNIKAMTEAKTTVRTIEITRTTHATKINKINIVNGKIIGLLDGELLAIGDRSREIVMQLLNQIDTAEAAIITLYYGKDTNKTEIKQLHTELMELYPKLEIGVVDGGQQNNDYIISVE